MCCYLDLAAEPGSLIRCNASFVDDAIFFIPPLVLLPDLPLPVSNARRISSFTSPKATWLCVLIFSTQKSRPTIYHRQGGGGSKQCLSENWVGGASLSSPTTYTGGTKIMSLLLAGNVVSNGMFIDIVRGGDDSVS